MQDFGYVYKANDTMYVIFADKKDPNVGVCVDENGDTAEAGYLLDEVIAYINANPTKVFTEYEDDESLRRRKANELYDLIDWFDHYFAMQLQQHSWQEDYTPSHDDIFDCDYATWEDLCAKANEVRAEIKALKEKL